MSKSVLMSLCLSMIFICGCGKKADENKPVAQVEAEAQKMSVEDLKATAMQYKQAIEAKKADLEKIADKIKTIPVTQLMSEEAKKLQSDLNNINNSINALKERFLIYVDQLRAKGGDISGLNI